MKTIDTEIYKCTRCPYEWLQRHKVIRDHDGRIKKIISDPPKNCSKCKSPSWQEPRS